MHIIIEKNILPKIILFIKLKFKHIIIFKNNILGKIIIFFLGRTYLPRF